MIREVDLTMYLPEFMQTYKEPVAALEAENPEFVIVWDAINRILYNHFVSTADEYGISRYEKLLGIFPSSQDTLESRRSRVQNKWFQQLPYTIRVFLQKLIMLCGTGNFTVTNNFTEGYILTINTVLELYGQIEELESIINIMIPENIVIDSLNSIVCDVSGTALFGGGVVFVNNFIITNDFKEAFDIDGTANFGGGIVQTDSFVITNDFNESYGISGDAKVASGTVYVDFYEID